MANTRMSAAMRQFLVEPVQRRSGSLFLLQLAQLVTDRCGGRYDALMQRALAAVKPKRSLPSSRLMDDRSIDSSVATLKARGWDILPWRLPAEDIAALRHFAFTTPAYAVHPGERIAITEANIPREHARYIWHTSEVIRIPAVQKLLADGALHRIAQDYIECRPILSSIALWLDPVYDGTYDAHIYHYDNDGPSFLKFFIYLKDVDAESGAHSFIQRTQVRLKPRQFCRSARYDRDELLKFYGVENEIVFEGPAGMILAEDTAGFHKGTTPSKDYRLLLQLQFTSLDHPQEDEYVGGIEKVRIAGLDPGIKRIARKFFA
jgi:hypothetical protein